MSFYDQVNGAAEKLIWDFVKGQFDPTDGSKKADFQPLTIKITMKTLSGDGTPDKVYTLKNAFITDAQHDTLDYSTSDVVLWTITVRYEDLEAPEFNGPVPVTVAGIPALPKPPRPQSSQKGKIADVPITDPPKADAKVERNRWVEAGGTETGGGAATGNPTLTNQTRLGNPNIRPGSLRDRAARANAAREAQRRWPENQSAAETARLNRSVSPSTGTPAPAVATPGVTTNTTPAAVSPTPRIRSLQQELTPAQQSFIAQEELNIKATSYSDEYKKAYIDNLKANPPQENSLTSNKVAQNLAEANALRQTPKYDSQSRIVDSGVLLNRSNLTKVEPAPPPVREGTLLSLSKVNDSKGNSIATIQVQREQQRTNRSRTRDY